MPDSSKHIHLFQLGECNTQQIHAACVTFFQIKASLVICHVILSARWHMHVIQVQPNAFKYSMGYLALSDIFNQESGYGTSHALSYVVSGSSFFFFTRSNVTWTWPLSITNLHAWAQTQVTIMCSCFMLSGNLDSHFIQNLSSYYYRAPY